MSNKLQLLGWPPLESFTWLRQLQEPSLLDVSTAPKACSSIVSCSCLHQIVTSLTLPSPLRPAQMFNFWGFCECRAAHRSYHTSVSFQNLYLNSFYMLEEALPLRKQRSSSPWRTEASFGVSTSQDIIPVMVILTPTILPKAFWDEMSGVWIGWWLVLVRQMPFLWGT